MYLKHPEIEKGDIVLYLGRKHTVTKVWNHGWREWWFDLEAVEPMAGLESIFNVQWSAMAELCKLVKKASVKLHPAITHIQAAPEFLANENNVIMLNKMV